MNNRVACRLVASFVLLVSGGCGVDGPEVVDISGRITKGGKPVSHVVLQFSPEVGRPSTARTDADGRYRPEFSQQIPHGVMPGTCRVSVQVVPERIDKPVDLTDSKYHPDMKEILRLFSDWRKSPIQIEISDDQREVNLDLDEYVPQPLDELDSDPAGANPS